MEVANTKFYRSPFSGSQADTCGKTDRLTEAPDETNRRFLRLLERSSKFLRGGNDNRENCIYIYIYEDDLKNPYITL
jgi:hypothetical protein